MCREDIAGGSLLTAEIPDHGMGKFEGLSEIKCITV